MLVTEQLICAFVFAKSGFSQMLASGGFDISNCKRKNQYCAICDYVDSNLFVLPNANFLVICTNVNIVCVC